jgi:gluconolactonase
MKALLMRCCKLLPLAVLMLTACDHQLKFSDLVLPEAKVEKISVGQEFLFLEGPAWDGVDKLYFTDIQKRIIYRYSPATGFAVFRENSNGANGLAFDNRGRLLACEQDLGRITALDSSGQLAEVVAADYHGKRFNSPNDLVCTRDGRLYFTDPNFSNKADLPQDQQIIYYRNPRGHIMGVATGMQKPNGIMLSPDGKTLYVVDTMDKYVKSYSIDKSGLPVNGRVFCELQLPQGAQSGISGADGLAMDCKGNLYVTASLGVQVIAPNGHILGIIAVPEEPANCEFGDKDRRTLFITARTGLYAIKLRIPGAAMPI